MTARFVFRGTDNKRYVFTGTPLAVRNIQRSVEAAQAKIEAAMEQSERYVKRGRVATPKEPSQASLVRAWARENGVEVGERGRVSAALVAAFTEAQG